jgi:hypothetical protein
MVSHGLTSLIFLVALSHIDRCRFAPLEAPGAEPKQAHIANTLGKMPLHAASSF